MQTKKFIVFITIFCLLIAGCSHSQMEDIGNTVPATESVPVETEELGTVTTEPADVACTISPLPDLTMNNLTDTILSVSLEEGDVYDIGNGILQMDLKIYTYDKYDMVDIAALKVGDTIARPSGEVTVISKEQDETGTIYINGGMDNNGFNLATDDCGIYYEMGFNDTKNWYEIGEATIRVSAEFTGMDHSDLDMGEVAIRSEDFLTGAVTNYDFTPYNTTVRVENGQIVEMNRRFIP